MKRYTLLPGLIAMLSSTISHAADWMPLENSGLPGQHFYDRSKLVIKGEEITYWRKVMFHAPQQADSQETASTLKRERIDCAEHTVKLLAHLDYSPSGERMEHLVPAEAEPVPIIPDTAEDAFERVLCVQVWQRQEEARIKAERIKAGAELAEEKTKMPAKGNARESRGHPSQPPVPVEPPSARQATDQLY